MPHFEIHATDVEQAKAIYAGLFGWQFTPMQGTEDAQFRLIQGGQVGGSSPLTGGLMARMGSAPHPGSSMTLEAADCDERYNWALSNGGSEALPPQDFSSIGRCANAEDGQGNIIGMMTPEQEGA